MKENIRFKHWLTSDYYVFISLISFILCLGIGIYNYFFGADSETSITIGFGIGAGVMLVLFVTRLLILSSLVRNAEETTATIKSIYFFRGSGRATFEFKYQGSTISSHWWLVRNSRSRKLKITSEVHILFNPNRPQQAIILDALNISQ